MANIELVIKIPEELYNHTQEYEVGGFNQENDAKLFMAIKNGTPLPKGHGKLVDADKAVNDYTNYGISHMWDATDLPYIMNECPTILEADKDVENDRKY